MWPDLIHKAKEGGLDVVETYVFWNGHEPEQGKVMEGYIFTQISPCFYPFSIILNCYPCSTTLGGAMILLGL